MSYDPAELEGRHFDFDVKRGDFVTISDGKKVYLVTQLDHGLHLWDFQAWIAGYYDAYIPLTECEYDELNIVGNLKDNPELLPPECEGYNGEPEIKVIEHIWP